MVRLFSRALGYVMVPWANQCDVDLVPDEERAEETACWNGPCELCDGIRERYTTLDYLK